MQPKTLERYQKRAVAVRDAVEHWSGWLSQGLSKLRADVHFEQEAPSRRQVQDFLRFFADLVDAQVTDLEQLVGQLRTLRSQLRDLRHLRDDQARSEVYDRVVRLRRSVQSAGGKRAEEMLFGTGKTSREAEPLARQARELHDRLQHGDLREILIDDPEKEAFVKCHGETLTEPLERLEDVLRKIVVGQSRERVAHSSLQRHKAALRRSLTGAFQMLEGLLKIAGQEELIPELRPKATPKKSADMGSEMPKDTPSASVPEPSEPEAAEASKP